MVWSHMGKDELDAAAVGTAVPAMLRERARDYPETGDNLTDLADELEEEHGA